MVQKQRGLYSDRPSQPPKLIFLQLWKSRSHFFSSQAWAHSSSNANNAGSVMSAERTTQESRRPYFTVSCGWERGTRVDTGTSSKLFKETWKIWTWMSTTGRPWRMIVRLEILPDPTPQGRRGTTPKHRVGEESSKKGERQRPETSLYLHLWSLRQRLPCREWALQPKGTLYRPETSSRTHPWSAMIKRRSTSPHMRQSAVLSVIVAVR